MIAGYDPLNEPSPGFAPGISETVALGAFYSDVLDGIRGAEADDGRPVPAPYFFEPGVEWSAGSITAPPVDPGFVADDAIVFAPHIYAESISPVSIPQGWDNAELVASVYGATVWTGEWGYFSASPADDDDPLRRFAAEEDARLLHSAFWDWRQACGDPHNFYPDRSSGRILSPSFVRYECPGDVELGIAPEFALVLSRSHPRAVPGTLTSTTSDIDTGALTVTGSTDAPGIADLWLPDRGTGNPVVDGGEVVAVHRVPATDRAAGGWRVQLRVEGDYTITAAVDGTAAPTVEPTEIRMPNSSGCSGSARARSTSARPATSPGMSSPIPRAMPSACSGLGSTPSEPPRVTGGGDRWHATAPRGRAHPARPPPSPPRSRASSRARRRVPGRSALARQSARSVRPSVPRSRRRRP